MSVGRTAIVVLILGLLPLASMASPARAAGNTYVVNTNGDGFDAQATCLNTDVCTLRVAIVRANQHPGPDTIAFDATVFGADNHVNLLQARGDLDFLDATQGITVDGSPNHIVIQSADPQNFTPNWGLVFQSPSGQAAHDVAIKNIGAEGTNYDAIQVCAGLVVGVACNGAISNVTMDRPAASNTMHAGIRLLGSSISGVSITNPSVINTFADSGIIIDTPGGTISDVSVTGEDSSSARTGKYGLEISSQDQNNLDSLGDISGVTITDLSTFKDTQGGVFIYGGNVQNVSVDKLTSSYANAVIIGHSHSLSNVSVTHTNITLAGIGIVIEEPGEGGPVDTVDISNNDITADEAIELISKSISNTTIENNFLHGGANFGIHLWALGSGSSNNVIKYNTVTGQNAGIRIEGAAAAAAISQNTTFNNTGLGIDLHTSGDGSDQVTHNDVGDADTGPNGLLNYPVITNVTPEELSGTACANCRIELFIATPDPTGYGEGDLFLRDARADSSGNFRMSLCELELDAGTALTSTATDAQGETSEFSLNFNLQTPTSTTCTVPSDTPTESPTHTATPTPTSSPSPTPTVRPGQHRQGDVNCNGDIDPDDGLLDLEYSIGLSRVAGECPPIAVIGDVDCDGDVDEDDAMRILAYLADVPRPNVSGCTHIGQPLPD
jgi:hypothetical protein